MKLFVIYVGENIKGCHLELHDMRFAIGNTIEDCYDQVRAQCWGIPEDLHLDCWGALEYADGYNVILKEEKPSSDQEQLFFVHLGGYTEDAFTEHHKNMFLVGTDAAEIKKRALSHEETKLWSLPHKDRQFDIDDIIEVQSTLTEKGLYIHLEKTDTPKTFSFECNYVPIGKF